MTRRQRLSRAEAEALLLRCLPSDEAEAFTFTGRTNIYLEVRLALSGHLVQIVGQSNLYQPCVCCGFCSWDGMAYSICLVCGWEYDGVTTLEQYSGPNHMTLGEARQYYLEHGHLFKDDPDPLRFIMFPHAGKVGSEF